MTNKIYTDDERSTIWGIKQASIEILEGATIPYCFNPENGHAVLLFDGRRRISSVLHIFNGTGATEPQIIRSKKAIIPFLEVGEVYPLQYGFGLTLKRINSEADKGVEIARIIAEFQFESLKDLNTYILKERPDLFSELTRRYTYFTKIINNFKSNNQFEKLNETLEEGVSALVQAIQNKNDN